MLQFLISKGSVSYTEYIIHETYHPGPRKTITKNGVVPMNERERYQELYQSLMRNDKPGYPGHLLERAAKLYDTKLAIIDGTTRITFSELFSQALRVSAFLKQSGIKKGDRVMILYENSVRFYQAYHGIWQMGAVVVPVNNFLHPRELHHVIANAEPNALIISDDLFTKYNEAITSIPLVITGKDLANIIQQEPVAPERIPSLLDSQDPKDMCVLLYTSGTTGMPKGVMLSATNVMMNMLQGAARFQAEPNDSVLVALPLFHSYSQNTCIWMTALLGITVIIVAKINRKALREGLEHKPTLVTGIPQFYGLFCLMKTAKFDQVRYFISGGDVLPDRIRMGFELIYRRKLCNGYGLSETSPFISADLEDVTRPTDTVGRPLIDVEVQMRDEEGNIMPEGSVGVLWVRGPNIMLGYYKNPEMTAEMIVDGWLNTGDLARITPEGKLILCGRQKDLIKSKGMKIYPYVIENILMKHPAVTAAGVIGKTDGGDEEFPAAYIAAPSVKTHEEKKALEDALRTLCRDNLAPYEIPRIFEIRSSLPTTATGKVNKKELRKET